MISNRKQRYKLLQKYRINFFNDFKINFFHRRKWNLFKKRFKRFSKKNDYKKEFSFCSKNIIKHKILKHQKKYRYVFNRSFTFTPRFRRFKKFKSFKKRRRNKFKKRIPSQFFRKYKINLSASQNTLKRYFKKSLNQKQFLKQYYGNIKNSQLKSIIQSVLTKKNLKNRYNIIFKKLNNKLDMVVLNMGFVNTIGEAQQLILHKKILVNGKVIKKFNQEVKINDVISIHPVFRYLIYKKLIYKLYIFNSLFLNDYLQYHFSIKYKYKKPIKLGAKPPIILDDKPSPIRGFYDIPESNQTPSDKYKLKFLKNNKPFELLINGFYLTCKYFLHRNKLSKINYFRNLSKENTKKYTYIHTFLIDKLYCNEQKYMFLLKNVYLLKNFLFKKKNKIFKKFLNYHSWKTINLLNNLLQTKPQLESEYESKKKIFRIYNNIFLNYKKLNKNLIFFKKDRLKLNKINKVILNKHNIHSQQCTFFLNFKSIPNYVINYNYLIGIFVKEFTANTLPSYKYLNLSTLIRYYTNYNNF